MYTIVPSKRFQKQLRRLQKSDISLLEKLERTIERLRLGKVLAVAQKDHKLAGRLKDFRECHIAPDWLLVYRRHEKVLILELLSTGTHATLFE